jgi:hypothetical protein
MSKMTTYTVKCSDEAASWAIHHLNTWIVDNPDEDYALAHEFVSALSQAETDDEEHTGHIA